MFDQIKITPREIRDIEVAGVHFERHLLFDVYVNDVLHRELPAFADSEVFLEELVASSRGDGKFLIFTCICGVADDAGCEAIIVQHKPGIVTWEVHRDEATYCYRFNQMTYWSEISACRDVVEKQGLPLAVTIAIWPE